VIIISQIIELVKKFKTRFAIYFIASLIVLFLFFRKVVSGLFRIGTNKNGIYVLVPISFQMGPVRQFSGSSKDLTSMIEQLNDIEFELINVSKSSLFAIYDLFYRSKLWHLVRADKILISISGSSGFLVMLLRLSTSATIVMRSHNAELPHRLHWLVLAPNIFNRIKIIKKLFLGFFGDILATLFAHRILSISDYEIEVYWKRLNPFCTNKFIYYPYKSPSWVKDLSLNKIYVTIVGGFDKSTLISNADSNFVSSGLKIQKMVHLNDLRLASYGDDTFYDFCDINFGFLDDVLTVMNQTSITLIPASSGWGFKTKIADAIELGQVVLIPRNLYNRIGIWKEVVIPVDDWEDINIYLMFSNDKLNSRIFIESIIKLRHNCFKSLGLV
jgi:hypothetical protein